MYKMVFEKNYRNGDITKVINNLYAIIFDIFIYNRYAIIFDILILGM